MAIFPSSAIPTAAATSFSIDNSLRLEDADSAYLNRNISGGNRKTFTISCWVKIHNESVQFYLLSGGSGGGDGAYEIIAFHNSNGLQTENGSGFNLKTGNNYRDPSAWYHLVVAFDTTQSIQANRLKMYINGEQQTITTSAGGLSLNQQMNYINNATCWIGGTPAWSAYNSDVYVAEYHFIDGQQLDPTSFGETDADYKHWKPKEVTGLTYGTNGFYLPFKHDTTAAGFGIVTYSGNGGSQSITSVGFQPDMVWIKGRYAINHHLFDTARGTGWKFPVDLNNAQDYSSSTLTSFDSDGFTLGGNSGANGNGNNYVAWCWDMGGTSATNNNGNIESSVRANTAKGQSFLTYTGDNVAGRTIGHGLTSAPELILCKAKDATEPWVVYNDTIGNTKHLHLDENHDAQAYTPMWNDTSPDNSVFTVGYDSGTNNTSGIIAYCFHSVTGYSSIGSYSGTGSSGLAVACGFKPRYVILKRTDSDGNWLIIDSDRADVSGADDNEMHVDSNIGEQNDERIDFTSTGFTLKSGVSGNNASGGTYIYIAFADTREALLWADKSGNSNDWTANNIDASDEMLDSPTNNFCTFNPIGKLSGSYTSGTMSEGNLKTHLSSPDAENFGTMAVSTGKWYWEVYTAVSSSVPNMTTFDLKTHKGGSSTRSYIGVSGGTPTVYDNGSESFGGTSTPSTSATDVLGIALDLDNGALYTSINGTWSNSGDPTSGASKTGATVTSSVHTRLASGVGEWTPAYIDGSAGDYGIILNCGQDSSFAGSVTAGTETDDNSNGSFKYDVPAGFLALCTNNLPEPAVKPQDNFNVVAYTGTGSSNARTDVGFQPDFTWIKGRSHSSNHRLMNSISGATKYLLSNATQAEGTDSQVMSSFDSTGFTVGTEDDTNGSTKTFVAWNWKAGNATLGTGDFTQGSIASTCSRNVDAGFSIVSYTGNETSGATVGHGLSKAPEMLIVKSRPYGESWSVYSKDMGNTKYMELDGAGTAATYTGAWNDTTPSSTLFTLGNGTKSNRTGTMIAYAFHSVDGYSKVGSYTGNGSSDGTFVYTGFKPAFVLIKGDRTTQWMMSDSERSSYNVVDDALYSSLSSSEASGSNFQLDYLSNGFKLRTANDAFNLSGTYIFLAFAEYPFKYTNAR